MTATPDIELSNLGPETPLDRAKQTALGRHDRLQRINDWECDGFEPAAGADGELVYCANCTAIVWVTPHVDS